MPFETSIQKTRLFFDKIESLYDRSYAVRPSFFRELFDMVPTATTVGGYLQSLPNERRVSMARVCSMIRRSARGVRESMRFGLAFYELEGPVFAVESRDRSLVFYFAEGAAAEGLGAKARGLDIDHRKIEFPDLNCLPLDVVETVVRNTLKLRRAREGNLPTQAELLQIWEIKEEDAAVAPPIVRIVVHNDDAP